MQVNRLQSYAPLYLQDIDVLPIMIKSFIYLLFSAVK